MAAKRRRSKDDALVAEMLGLKSASQAREAPRIAAREGGRSKEPGCADYRRALREHFSRGELLEIISESRKRVWPRLNRDPVRLVTANQFVKHWSPLGVDFRLAKLPWPDGLAMLGFYVRRTKGLFSRPVICVNTVHHPALVGITFDHEMGHHLTSQIFVSSHDAAFSLNIGYAGHMHDAAELAADILVAVGIYPQTSAGELFADVGQNIPVKLAGHELTERLSAPVQDFLVSHYLGDGGNLSAEKKSFCKAGLAHYTILRQALLEEFDL